MGAVDPTYPLYPIACILASAMLLLVLTTNFVRQSWNLGVALLCFWLFFENMAFAVDAIVWSDNADIKLYIYCDIVSHLREVTYVVKPMATLIITRRLYLIASLQSVEFPNKAARRWDLALEWMLGLIIPILVAGPIYYVNQGARFFINEGFGCGAAEETSILDILMEQSWTVVPPLISIVFYYPQVTRTYYRQRRDIDSILHSNSSVSHTNYLRILVLASIDILLTLPIGIVNITLNVVYALSPPKDFPFYPGWNLLHTDWEPEVFSYAQIQAGGTAELAQLYFSAWTSPVLAFAIFGLFGVTSEARASYWRIICTVGGWFGWKPTPRARNGQTSLGEIEFGARPQDASGIDLEMGSRPPSFINTNMPATSHAAHTTDGCAGRESETDLKSVEETRRNSDGFASDANPQHSFEHRELAVEETSFDFLDRIASDEHASAFKTEAQGSYAEDSAMREVGSARPKDIGDASNDNQCDVEYNESIAT